MSESIKTICETIIEYGLSYKQSVINALETYRKEKAYAKQDSEKYKDSADYYTQKQHEAAEKALSSLKSANNCFKSDMSYTLDKYKDNLKSSFLLKIDSDFIPTLRLYKDFDIPISRIEIENLVKLANDNISALSAINKVLEQTESNYTLSFISISEHDKTIIDLTKLSLSPYFVPGDFLSEGIELYKETPCVYINDSLTEYQTGHNIDNLDLLLYSTEFDSIMKAIQETVLNYETVSKCIITKSNTPAVKQAQELGKEEANRNNSTKEGLKNYL